jgi:phage shock protein C
MKRLTLSETKKQAAGVCGGIAEYFGIDPTLVRALFVLATLMGGPGLLIYIVLWIVIPKPDAEFFEDKPKRF